MFTKALARLVWWLTDVLPMPEPLEFGLSEWAYVQMHKKDK